MSLAIVTTELKMCRSKDCAQGNPQARVCFSKNSKNTDGLQHYCRACAALKTKKHQAANPKKWAAYARNYRKRNPDKRCAQALKYRVAHPERVKDTVLKRCFGITIAQYSAMHQRQNGKCAICLRDESEFKKALAVDHAHSTGKVRGLLCHHCNTAIGLLEEKEQTLNAAIAYLEAHKC